MFSARRFAALVGLAFAFIAVGNADGQKKRPVVEPPFSGIKFATDAKWRAVLQASRTAIEDKEWKDAIFALQHVLNLEKDVYVEVIDRRPGDPKSKWIGWQSTKFIASELIGSMPAEGRAAYEKTHGTDARAALDIALMKKDDKLLAEVVVRYRHTKAGGAAHALLAERVKLDVPKVDGWPSWRGNAANTGQATASAPLLDKKLWSRPIFMDVVEPFPEKDNDKAALDSVTAAIKQINDLKQPVLPGFFPIASQRILVYRSHRDIRAVAQKGLTFKDEESGLSSAIKPGEIVWKSIPMNRSLAMLLEKNSTNGRTTAWLDDFGKAKGFNSILYENTLIGTLSADDEHVYAINALGVPPHLLAFRAMFGPMNPEFAWGDLEPLVLQNELHCYDLVKGKLKWDLGASDFLQGKPNDPEFAHSHFLGVPINIGGKLYVLNEKVLNPNVKPKEGVNLIPGDSELRLVCLDPKKLVQINSNMKPTIESIVSLGKVAEEERMLQNIRRRVNAATPAYADGILVCPTNAGELLGIDLLTRTLTWSYSYRESAPLPIVLPGMPEPKGGGTTVVSKWKSSPPAIQDGKVVFTAPDADSIHCVNLKGGRPVWRKSQQKGDRYFAGVFGNRVLIVGDTSIRALDLKDGNLLWSLVTGDLPSGQGAAANGIYYLPLTKEILAVDIAKGIVKAHNRFPAGASSPGNLVFYQDLLLSQTATDVTAYPQLKFDK